MLIPAAMLLLVSCSSGDDEGGDATAEGTSAATAESTSDGGGSSGSGGSSISSGDINQLIDDLQPPNSSEVARFSAADGTNVSFQSSDSLDDLKNFYDEKLADLGITISGTMTVEGTQTWIFGEDEGVGGAVSVSSDGENSIVTIIVGE